jgi:hypothetical protein
MNVTTKTGYICVDILKKGHKEGWSHALTFQSVALSIVSLLDDPNPGVSCAALHLPSNLHPLSQIVHLVCHHKLLATDCFLSDINRQNLRLQTSMRRTERNMTTEPANTHAFRWKMLRGKPNWMPSSLTERTP